MSGFIYFIDNEDGAVKIGYTTNLAGRIAGLQTGVASKLIVLGYLQGTLADEAALHEKFAALRLRGEWFQQSPGLMAWIRENARPLEAGVLASRPAGREECEFTKASRDIARRLIEILAELHGSTQKQAAACLVSLLGWRPGELENLMRGRLVAVTAQQFDELHRTEIDLLQAYLAHLRQNLRDVTTLSDRLDLIDLAEVNSAFDEAARALSSARRSLQEKDAAIAAAASRRA